MSDEAKQNIADIRTAHPFPWGHRVLLTPTGGLVQLFDASGKEVPIMTMVGFCELLTRQLMPKTP